MAYKNFYKASVEKDLEKIDRQEARKVLSKIEKDLGNNPDKGNPLKGSYQGLFRYRVGDHRVIYTKVKEGILVLRIAHRKHVYR